MVCSAVDVDVRGPLLVIIVGIRVEVEDCSIRCVGGFIEGMLRLLKKFFETIFMATVVSDWMCFDFSIVVFFACLKGVGSGF